MKRQKRERVGGGIINITKEAAKGEGDTLRQEFS